MSSERATIRPVTLSRLVELTHACECGPMKTEDLNQTLDATHRRVRESILEAVRERVIESIS